MQSILLIEDSSDIPLLVMAILKNRHQVFRVATLAEARVELLRHSYQLILLDVGLPDGDGFEFCSELRQHPTLCEVPIVLLTGKAQTSDRVLGWTLGIVDYIEKPFNPLEFKARIEAHIHKQKLKSHKTQLLVKGLLKIDPGYHEAVLITPQGDTPLSLTRNEFKLLYHFMTHAEHVLTREQLQTAVWGDNTHITMRTIDKHVSALRSKLSTEADAIQTVTGLGYRFSPRKSA